MTNLLEESWSQPLYDDGKPPEDRCPCYRECLDSVSGDKPRLIMSPFGFMGGRLNESGAALCGERIAIVGLNGNDGADSSHAMRSSPLSLVANIAADYARRRVIFLSALIPFLREVLALHQAEPQEVFDHVAFVNVVKCAPNNTPASAPTDVNMLNCLKQNYAVDELRYIRPTVVVCIHHLAFQGLNEALEAREMRSSVWSRAWIDKTPLDILRVWHPSVAWSSWTVRRWEATLMKAIPDLQAPKVEAWAKEPLFAGKGDARRYNELLISLWRFWKAERSRE